MNAKNFKIMATGLLSFMLAAILVLGVNEKVMAAKTPKLADKTIVIKVGEKKALSLNKVSNVVSVKWSSKSKRIATVTKKGIVKGIKKGKTVITCKVVIKKKIRKKIYKLKCKVTVERSQNTYESSPNVEIADSNIGFLSNWSGVSPLQQFSYKDEGIGYAYLDKKSLHIVTCSKELTINSEYSLLGDVIADKDGNFYVVWGENNKTNNADVETVVISKYSPDGKEIKSTGFVGKSSPWGNSNDAKTKEPFAFGNCTSVIYAGKLVCYHAKKRYDGHQSDQVIAVNIDTMQEYSLSHNTYAGHSFNQDVIYSSKVNDFVFACLGDCYSRGFRVNRIDGGYGDNKEIIFHSYLQANAGYNMAIVNNVFAQFGGIGETSEGVVLAGASVKSLDENAKTEKQNLFIQIVNPVAGEKDENMFVNGERRTGNTALGMYDKEVKSITDYGVIWLTDYTNQDVIAPQIITADNKIILMWNENKNDSSEAFYMVLSESGNVITPRTYVGKDCLNSYEKPIYYKGKIYWAYSKDKKIKLKSITL